MQRRVPVHLHRDATIKSLPIEDVRAILRGADSLITSGGRTLLTKILKGRCLQDVLGHRLEENPAYGFYRDLTPEEILARIDWTILNEYLRVEYAGRLPVLVTPGSDGQSNVKRLLMKFFTLQRTVGLARSAVRHALSQDRPTILRSQKIKETADRKSSNPRRLGVIDYKEGQA
jgi:hypothetical protein